MPKTGDRASEISGRPHHGASAAYPHHNQIGLDRIGAPQYSRSRIAELDPELLLARRYSLLLDELLQLIDEKGLQSLTLWVVRRSSNDVEQSKAGLEFLRKRQRISERTYGVDRKVSGIEDIAKFLNSTQPGIRLRQIG